MNEQREIWTKWFTAGISMAGSCLDDIRRDAIEDLGRTGLTVYGNAEIRTHDEAHIILYQVRWRVKEVA